MMDTKISLDSRKAIVVVLVHPMSAGKKKTCKRGHPLNKKNTYAHKDGSRECRQCSIDRATAASKQRHSSGDRGA